jgi:hypothetical protein
VWMLKGRFAVRRFPPISGHRCKESSRRLLRTGIHCDRED